MLLIGSRALLFRASVVLNRPPADFDFICTRAEAEAWFGKHADSLKWTNVYSPNEHKLIVEGEIPVEFELLENRTSAQLLYEAVKQDPNTIHTEEFGMVPSLDVLFLLKKSHRFAKDSPHFWKTVQDYHRMKALGATVRAEHEHILRVREQETYTHKHPKLNVTKDKFFVEDQVPYVYDHDSIHEAVKVEDTPAYRNFLADDAQVMCSKEKFFALDQRTRLLSVLEESYVLSIERSQVPHPGVLTPRQSFLVALSKVCTSITSGWWREFAYENIHEVLAMYSEEYITKFWDAERAGRILPYQGTNYGRT